MNFELGTKVKDIISGYSGTVVARTEWLNGCVTYKVRPNKLDKDGAASEGINFDEEELKLVSDKNVLDEKPTRTGGPRRSVSRRIK